MEKLPKIIVDFAASGKENRFIYLEEQGSQAPEEAEQKIEKKETEELPKETADRLISRAKTEAENAKNKLDQYANDAGLEAKDANDFKTKYGIKVKEAGKAFTDLMQKIISQSDLAKTAAIAEINNAEMAKAMKGKNVTDMTSIKAAVAEAEKAAKPQIETVSKTLDEVKAKAEAAKTATLTEMEASKKQQAKLFVEAEKAYRKKAKPNAEQELRDQAERDKKDLSEEQGIDNLKNQREQQTKDITGYKENELTETNALEGNKNDISLKIEDMNQKYGVVYKGIKTEEHYDGKTKKTIPTQIEGMKKYEGEAKLKAVQKEKHNGRVNAVVEDLKKTDTAYKKHQNALAAVGTQLDNFSVEKENAAVDKAKTDFDQEQKKNKNTLAEYDDSAQTEKDAAVQKVTEKFAKGREKNNKIKEKVEAAIAKREIELKAMAEKTVTETENREAIYFAADFKAIQDLEKETNTRYKTLFALKKNIADTTLKKTDTNNRLTEANKKEKEIDKKLQKELAALEADPAKKQNFIAEYMKADAKGREAMVAGIDKKKGKQE